MNQQVQLSTFPSCRNEALALIYVQSRDLSGKTPEEIANIYSDALMKISGRFKEMRREKASNEERPGFSAI